MPEANLTT